MKRNTVGLLVLMVAWFLPLAGHAQVQPTERVIPLTGTLPGQPDGPVDLRLRLFPVNMGGAFCFEETQLGVQVTGEAFSVFLGEGTPGGIPPAPCFTENTSLWIAVALDAAPAGEIGGRTAITSSGYAHFALAGGSGGGGGVTAVTASAPLASSGGATPNISLPNVIVGGSNTAIGVQALQSNTTGNSNTASGTVALRSNTTGSQNTATGDTALANNTTGGNNTASGANALQFNTTGDDNTASGTFALRRNTTGFRNTASGGNALFSNTTGARTTASGESALFSNTTGVNNTASGASALFSNTTGSNNTASGFVALRPSTTGDNNTASGSFALFSNTTGSNNTAIGFGADVSAGNLTNATAIGANAVVAQSNSLVLGNNANVGIGTTAPAAKLHIVGTTRTGILQITGGADLSEQFEVRRVQNLGSAASQEQVEPGVEPGMVVSIDSDNPGKLIVSTQAYNRRVAGIISGAGGLNPGMLMGQSGSEADGKHPVALTGRVYAWADASNGAIKPGDLLTTSKTPGHAMKVTNHAKAQGAIIGKAMTALKEGKGLVLVLVSLQ